MDRIRFVHTADLHLDSPFLGLGGVSETMRTRLRESTFAALNRIVNLCLEEGVDFLLIAGDIYDAADVGLRAQVRLRDALQRLSDEKIYTYIAHGNHDPCDGVRADLDWPERVRFFSSEGVESCSFRRDGQVLARILGISYPTAAVRENYAARFHHKGTSLGIGVLHANVGGETDHGNYAPCSVEDLARSGCDYWALGHIHDGRVLRERDPWVIYPGNPQGRHPRETGERGCFLIEAVREGREPWRITPRFVTTDVVRWLAREVSIDGLETEQALIDSLHETLADARAGAGGRSVLVRLRLTGRGVLHASLRRPAFVEELLDVLRSSWGRPDSDEFLWVDSIKVQTDSQVDEEQLLRAESLVGDFVRLIEQAKRSAETSDWEGVREAIEPLYHHRRARRFLDEPGEKAIVELLDAAKKLGIDRLVEDGE